MPISTRFFTAKIDRAYLNSKRILTEDAEREYKAEVSEVADWWSNRIRASGRGGRHNAQMSRIESRVTSNASRFNIRVGWLGSPPQAEDGKTTWFVYQDTGYDLFGRGRYFVPGLMLQLDARQRLVEGIRDANERLARRVEQEWGRA